MSLQLPGDVETLKKLATGLHALVDLAPVEVAAYGRLRESGMVREHEGYALVSNKGITRLREFGLIPKQPNAPSKPKSASPA